MKVGFVNSFEGLGMREDRYVLGQQEVNGLFWKRYWNEDISGERTKEKGDGW